MTKGKLAEELVARGASSIALESTLPTSIKQERSEKKTKNIPDTLYLFITTQIITQKLPVQHFFPYFVYFEIKYEATKKSATKMYFYTLRKQIFLLTK